MSLSQLLQITSIRYYVFGLAIAPIFMAFFGTMWWGIGSDGLQTFLGNVLFFVVIALVAVVLLSGSIMLIQSSRHLPQDTSSEAKALGKVEGRRYGKWFSIVFGLEIVIITGGNSILYAVHHPEFTTPFMAIVVGVHFLPLASLFKVPLYYVTGILMVVAGSVTLLLVPVTMTLGQGRAWDVLLGGTCALILWLTGIYTLVLGRNYLTKAHHMVQALA